MTSLILSDRSFSQLCCPPLGTCAPPSYWTGCPPSSQLRRSTTQASCSCTCSSFIFLLISACTVCPLPWLSHFQRVFSRTGLRFTPFSAWSDTVLVALLKPLLNLDDVVVLLNKDRLQPPLDIVLALLRLLLLLVVVAGLTRIPFCLLLFDFIARLLLHVSCDQAEMFRGTQPCSLQQARLGGGGPVVAAPWNTLCIVVQMCSKSMYMSCTVLLSPYKLA